ncbi:MAG: hypothetical protein AAF334_09640 [Pseudomonadota bacterium]
MIRNVSLLALVAMLAACQQPGGLDASGRGDPAPLFYAPPGTQLLLRNTIDGEAKTQQIAVEPPRGPRGAYRDSDGRSGGFYPGCWGCGGEALIQEEAYRALWPLETGKQTTFIRRTPDGVEARVLIRVAGVQVVRTEAGTFQTFLLDGRIEHLTGPRFSAQVKAWWAPDPGWVIRAEGGDSGGSTLVSEVIGVTPAGT